MRCKDEGIEQSDGAFYRLGNTAHDAQADSVAMKMSYDKLF